jgi:signal peptidase I
MGGDSISNVEVNRPPNLKGWKIGLLIIFFCIPLPAIVLLFRMLGFQPFNMPSKSSEPNMLVGDLFLVSKFSYGYSKHTFPFGIARFDGRILGAHPKPGDLAIFKFPKDPRIDYIKRVIGVPGDQLQMLHGVLSINGAAVGYKEEQLPSEFYKADGNVKYFRETLPNGCSYIVADLTLEGAADNTQEYVVPAGHYFVMGDNRDNSQDSRYIDALGYVPEENFVGKVVLLFANKAGESIANRPAAHCPAQ